MQRFVWDLMYPNPPSDNYDLPISAVYKNTPFVPQGPFVMPGKYTVRLTVSGHVLTQPLLVRMDPRVTTPVVGLQQQFDLSMQAYEGIKTTDAMSQEMRKVSLQLRDLRGKASVSTDVAAIEQKIAQLNGSGGGRGRGAQEATAVDELAFGRLGGAYTSILELLQEPDAAPTNQAVRDLASLNSALTKAEATWTDIRVKDLAALNAKLTQAGLAQVGK
jgi:hypothetical protein